MAPRPGVVVSLQRLLLLAVVPALMLVGVHILLQFLADWFALDGRFIGPDAYMRVLRVGDLASGGSWYEPVAERSNAPYGEILHWTRPLDLLLLLGGILGAPFLGFDGALFAWATVFGPVLHIFTLVVLLWACHPLLNQKGLMLLGLLFTVQFFVSFQFAVGRPDHHGLNILFFIWQMGFAFRLSAVKCLKNLPLFAALPAALALWISIEGAVGTAMILTALCTAWIIHGGVYLHRMRLFLVSLSVGLILVLVAERLPSDLLTVEFDRLSVVHIALFAILTLAALCMPRMARLGNRLSLAVAAGVLTLTVLGLWVPDFFSGPMAAMDPLVYEIWFRNNAEVSPTLELDDMRRTGPKALAHLGLVIYAVPILVVLFFHYQGERRRNFAILSVFLLAGTALALRETRWMGYPQILCLPPCIVLLQVLFARNAGPGLGRTAVRVGAVIVLATGPLIGGGLLRHAMPVPKQEKSCGLSEMALFLGVNYEHRPQTLLNFIYYGPELLYRTHHFVIATPYHRNTDGIVDTIKFLRSTDELEAISLIEERHIDLVLICPSDPEADNYRQTGDTPTLFMRLESDQPPPWLTMVPLPAELGQKFKLFQTQR